MWAITKETSRSINDAQSFKDARDDIFHTKHINNKIN